MEGDIVEIQDGSAKFVVKDIRENEQEIQKNKTDISEVQAEQQRLSQALTGYVPLDWSNVTKTPLLSQAVYSGDITLAQPYTNFDYLLICFGPDDQSYLITRLISRFHLDFLFNGNSLPVVVLVEGNNNYWLLNKKTSTSTFFDTNNENCGIYQIYGIKINN